MFDLEWLYAQDDVPITGTLGGMCRVRPHGLEDYEDDCRGLRPSRARGRPGADPGGQRWVVETRPHRGVDRGAAQALVALRAEAEAAP